MAFSAKRYKGSLDKWLIPGQAQRKYVMSREHLVPENETASAVMEGYQKDTGASLLKSETV